VGVETRGEEERKGIEGETRAWLVVLGEEVEEKE
jgi:hypothetical protein